MFEVVKVRCLRCGGKAEGKDKKEADMRIDHGIGLSIGKPCKGYPHATTEIVESEQPTEKPKEEVKTKVTIEADEVEIKPKETKSESKKSKKKSKKDS